MKIEEDEQNYFPEDVPFPEYFQRLSIEKLKERLFADSGEIIH